MLSPTLTDKIQGMACGSLFRTCLTKCTLLTLWKFIKTTCRRCNCIFPVLQASFYTLVNLQSVFLCRLSFVDIAANMQPAHMDVDKVNHHGCVSRFDNAFLLFRFSCRLHSKFGVSDLFACHIQFSPTRTLYLHLSESPKGTSSSQEASLGHSPVASSVMQVDHRIVPFDFHSVLFNRPRQINTFLSITLLLQAPKSPLQFLCLVCLEISA
jgi:hypothetical protein